MAYIFRRGNNIFKHSNQIFYHTGLNPDLLYKAYGIIYDENNPGTSLERIGNLAKHASLPVQSQMKRCILNDNGTVNYYLHPNDSTKKADGVTASNTTGTDGQVMVEIPAHWQYFTKDGSKHYAWVSDEFIDGFTYVPKTYYGAFFAQNVSSKLNSISGVLATSNISRTNFRNYARARGTAGNTNWNIDNYYQRKIIFWLYMIEYAQSNSQADIDNTLTVEGYKKGGLGIGATTYWPNNPYIVNGKTLGLGNNTGQIVYTYTGGYPITVNSYRGIEMPFGHIWSWTDGYNTKVNGTNLESWTSDNPVYWNDIEYTSYKFQGNIIKDTSGQFVRNILGNGNYIATANNVAGSDTTYLCDKAWGNIGNPINGLLSGCDASSGSGAGLACARLVNAPSNATAGIGSRLCYIP